MKFETFNITFLLIIYRRIVKQNINIVCVFSLKWSIDLEQTWQIFLQCPVSLYTGLYFRRAFNAIWYGDLLHLETEANFNATRTFFAPWKYLFTKMKCSIKRKMFYSAELLKYNVLILHLTAKTFDWAQLFLAFGSNLICWKQETSKHESIYQSFIKHFSL